MDKRRYAYLALPVFIALVVLYLCCFIPPHDIPKIDSPLSLDKLVHFLMFVALSAACFVAYYQVSIGSNGASRRIAVAVCILFPIFFGGLIEVLQARYFPGRSGDWYDFLADLLGVLFVVPFALRYKHYLEKKYEKNR